MHGWGGGGVEHFATAQDWFLFSSVIPGEKSRTFFIYLLITELGSMRDGVYTSCYFYYSPIVALVVQNQSKIWNAASCYNNCYYY